MEWISVKEKLPKEYYYKTPPMSDIERFFASMDVLVVGIRVSNNHPYLLERRIYIDSTKNGKWCSCKNGDYIITHWMPIPSLPGNETDETDDFIELEE